MNLILQETVVGLGKLGDTVTVRQGYGRNFLLPHGKALPATPEHIASLEVRRAELEKVEAGKLEAAQTRAGGFKGLTLEIKMQASEEGRLYGSVTPIEILAALAAKGKEVEKSEVLMPGPVRELGEHKIVLKFHPEVEEAVIVQVVADTDE